MEKQPLVSIITPCYNGEKFIKQFFESVLNQTYSNLELIFINDGSDDKTEEIALLYQEEMQTKGIRFAYCYQENAGQAAALNRGLKIFSGEYLTWPDSDDIMKPDCIEKKVHFLINNPEFGLCICKTEIVEENSKDTVMGIYEREKPLGEDCFFEDILFLRNVYFTPGGYMVCSKALTDTIPDKEIYTGKGGQNAQVLLPILSRYKCGYMKEVLNTYVIRHSSHSHSITDSKKVIHQLKLYEVILLETLKRIDETVLKQYEMPIKKHYAKLRFGNAIDSEDKQCIREEFCNLRKCRGISIKELLVYIKKTIL